MSNKQNTQNTQISDQTALRLHDLLMRIQDKSTAEIAGMLGGISVRAVERILNRMHDYVDWDYIYVNGKKVVHIYTDSSSVRPRPMRPADVKLLEKILAYLEDIQRTEAVSAETVSGKTESSEEISDETVTSAESSESEEKPAGLTVTDLTDLGNLIWRIKWYLGWRSRSASISARRSILPDYELYRQESGDSPALYAVREKLIHELLLGVERIGELSPEELLQLNNEILALKDGKSSPLLAAALFKTHADIFPCDKCRKTYGNCLADEWDMKENEEAGKACARRFKESL